MKIIVGIGLLLLGLVKADDNCPQALETQCITDVNHVIDICDKAARSKGKDQQADLQCIKYSAAMRTDCWPCVCQIAREGGFQVKGC